jgi:hypothetical protein
MKRLIAASSSLTLVNAPRRMACRVMIADKLLTDERRSDLQVRQQRL